MLGAGGVVAGRLIKALADLQYHAAVRGQLWRHLNPLIQLREGGAVIATAERDQGALAHIGGVTAECTNLVVILALLLLALLADAHLALNHRCLTGFDSAPDIGIDATLLAAAALLASQMHDQG